ncbi:MAG: hypothetical protein ABEN55_18510, partial [Bradymonadaceae bacterium]
MDTETGPVDTTSHPCPFKGLTEGVCSNGTTVSGTRDAGDRVSGDAGNRCRAPDNYRAEETPPREASAPYVVCDQKDNDCDGTIDEGCPCEFIDRSAGVCGGQTISASSGDCQIPEK